MVVTVVGGAEPEAWSTCLPVSLVVGDNLADEEPRTSEDSSRHGVIGVLVVDRARVGVDDLPVKSPLIGEIGAPPELPHGKNLAGIGEGGQVLAVKINLRHRGGRGGVVGVGRL